MKYHYLLFIFLLPILSCASLNPNKSVSVSGTDVVSIKDAIDDIPISKIDSDTQLFKEFIDDLYSDSRPEAKPYKELLEIDFERFAETLRVTKVDDMEFWSFEELLPPSDDLPENRLFCKQYQIRAAKKKIAGLRKDPNGNCVATLSTPKFNCPAVALIDRDNNGIYDEAVYNIIDENGTLIRDLIDLNFDGLPDIRMEYGESPKIFVWVQNQWHTWIEKDGKRGIMAGSELKEIEFIDSMYQIKGEK